MTSAVQYCAAIAMALASAIIDTIPTEQGLETGQKYDVITLSISALLLRIERELQM